VNIVKGYDATRGRQLLGIVEQMVSVYLPSAAPAPAFLWESSSSGLSLLHQQQNSLGERVAAVR